MRALTVYPLQTELKKKEEKKNEKRSKHDFILSVLPGMFCITLCADL